MKPTPTRLFSLLLILISSVLLPAALPNEFVLYGNPFLGFFCMAFFFWGIYLSPSHRYAALLGVVFGGLSTLLANYWLINFNAFAVFTLGGPVIGYMAYNAILAIVIRCFSRIKSLNRPIIIAAVFCVYEYLKSTGFLGYPWGLISYPVNTILPLLQFADITGVWGISFIMALYNTLFAEFFHVRFSPNRLDPAMRFMPRANDIPVKRLKTQFVFALALLAIMFSYGTARLIAGFPAKDSVSTLLVQQNAYPWGDDRAEISLLKAVMLTQEGLEKARSMNKKIDLIVWNETALKYPVRVFEQYPFRQSYPYPQITPGLFEKFNAYTITGAPAQDPDRKYYNAALMVTPDGRVTEYYAKQHPVPFVEHIPMYNIPVMREFFNKVVGIYQSWTMGSTTKLLTLPRSNRPDIKIGVPICFEDVFADLCAGFVKEGADILVNISNDSWSQTNSALTQHLAAARFRAIENRRTLVRSTNAGLTCVIDASGAIIRSTDMFAERTILSDVPVYREKMLTLYTMFPDAFPWVLLVLLSIVMLFEVLGVTWGGLAASCARLFSNKKT